MSIRSNFCPKCGKPTDETGLCVTCRIGSVPWFTCDNRVRHTECPSCGAVKQVNTWTDSEKSRDEIAPELAKTAVHFIEDVKKPSIEVTVEDLTVNRSRATMTVRGMLYKKPVEGTCTTEIIWQKEQCDRCNRISGSYYEGVVQVRAEGRIPGNYETQMAGSIAQEVEDSLQAGGERLSFISDVTPSKDGIDITVGSQHIGLQISQRIVAQLGGRYTTHPKLVGEKNGRQLFRITYSVRLPRFQKYDVVKVKNRFLEVERVESHYVRAMDLHDGMPKSIRDDDVERIVGNARTPETALVAYADKTTIGIMDPVTQKTKEIRAIPWMTVRAGDHVSILRNGDDLIIIR
ncbi:MAG: NMD protein affecting ribosome stability and mRNA decay [Methanomicrobiales archaeon]|nr:NMD protein affecting ribosome stability and mRNA decay [Methanomicrobiales archaeon]